ncbi:hypothetical protein ACEWPJ_01080 [Aliiroseovarius sp. YM-037]
MTCILKRNNHRRGATKAHLSGLVACGIAVLLATLPNAVVAGDVQLKPQDIVDLGPLGLRAPGLTLPASEPESPVIGGNVDEPGAGLLRRLLVQGKAAGFAGLLYDNRDRGHSALPPDLFPGLTRVTYGPELQASDIGYGLAGQLLFPVPTLGNSSTALTDGPAPRSLPRQAMTSASGPSNAFRAYAANHLYVYPEHRDHDAADLFPANWPYTVTTQGSSGSDQPFLRALLMSVAAFRPETRQRLKEENLIAPTLQMLLRRNQTGVYDAENYLLGATHPTVFDAARLSPERMISHAAALLPEDIPPMVRLRVEEDTFSTSAGLANLSERLFTTPAAVARVWRGFDTPREMVISANGTVDPNDRDLTFSWVLLRGNPDAVQITPLDQTGTRARIEFGWQDARPINRREPRLSPRVDIGVFAWNGLQFSAPAFVSVSFPTHQVRRYDDAGRLLSIDYDAVGRGAAFDPILHWSAGWRDTFRYDEGGTLIGWDRTDASGDPRRFDQNGNTADGQPVAYELGMRDGKTQLSETAPQQ